MIQLTGKGWRTLLLVSETIPNLRNDFEHQNFDATQEFFFFSELEWFYFLSFSSKLKAAVVAGFAWVDQVIGRWHFELFHIVIKKLLMTTEFELFWARKWKNKYMW